MSKEIGDLRKIALALEKMAEIDSTLIPEEIGDLKRIAKALRKMAGIPEEGTAAVVGTATVGTAIVG